MPLTKPQAEALATLAALLRDDLANRTGCPTWNQAGILAQLREVARFPAEDVALAVIRAAVDQGAHTPGVIPSLDGPHWREKLSTAHAPRNPLPHETCPEHEGQYRLSCSFRPPCGPALATVTPIRPGVKPPAELDAVREKLRADQAAYHARMQEARAQLEPKDPA